uniref:Peptidase metallopeptidase domain-containing protein n=1 Tax=Panagrolaimus superbus TaxID=310955 RepID=A0A914YCR0_9BILA
MYFIVFFSLLISSTHGFHLRDYILDINKESNVKRQAVDESKIRFSCGVSDFQGVKLRDTVPWQNDRVTYMVLIESKKLSQDIVRRTLRQAFDIWSAEIPREFVEVNDESSADIKIGFVTGKHCDMEPFAKNSNVFAHANPSGVLHFNDDIPWKSYSNADNIELKSIDFFWVALHELGHVLGLAHNTKVPKSVMENIYKHPADQKGRYREPRLIPEDVDDIREIYGARIGK